MTIQLDGLSWNLALGNGAAQGYTLNPAEAQEYVYEVAGIAADTMTGGVRANVIPKEGGNRFTGFALASHTSGDLQSDNLTDELQAAGLQAANPIKRLYDYNAAVGGPLKRDKVWFFASFRQWDQKEQVTGHVPSDRPALVYLQSRARSGRQRRPEPAGHLRLVGAIERCPGDVAGRRRRTRSACTGHISPAGRFRSSSARRDRLRPRTTVPRNSAG